MSDSHLTPADIEAAGLADWRPLIRALYTRFLTGNFVTGLRLANAIGEAAEAANHHPDIDLRYPYVNVRLFSHDVLGITDRDVALARRISEIAAEMGVEADPSAVSIIELALDTPDHSRIKPFWRTVMGYRDHPVAADEVRHVDDDLPTIWFQTSGAGEPRQRFHIDVRLAPEALQARIDAAVAAGGSLLYDEATFTVLADADGNRVCLCRN